MKASSFAVRTLRLAVPLYLSTVLLGLLPTSVATIGLAAIAGGRPWRADLLGSGWLNLALEIVMTAIYQRDETGVVPLVAALVVLLPLAMLGQLVAYSFLAGGMLEALAAGESGPPRFWPACRRWFWPSLRLTLLGGILLVAAVGLGAVISSLLGPVGGPEVSLLVPQAILAIALGWLELARACMVLQNVRSVGRALWLATGGAFRPLAIVAWIALSVPGTALVLAAVTLPAIEDAHAWTGLMQAVLLGQGVAFLGAWLKVIRLAAAVRFARLAAPETPRTASAPAARAS